MDDMIPQVVNCPTCGAENEFLFVRDYQSSSMMGDWTAQACESCDEWFTAIWWANGDLTVYWCDPDADWMYAAGMRWQERIRYWWEPKPSDNHS